MATPEEMAGEEPVPDSSITILREITDDPDPVYHLFKDGQEIGQADVHLDEPTVFIDWIGPPDEASPEEKQRYQALLDGSIALIAAGIRLDYPSTEVVEDGVGDHF